MSNSPELEALLAQAETSLREKEAQKTKLETEVVEKTIEGDLDSREASIEEAKKRSEEIARINLEIEESRAKVGYAESEIKTLDEKADMLKAAGLEDSLNTLYKQRNAELEESQQNLLSKEGLVGNATEQMERANQTIENIVPGHMEDTLTPEQIAARGALEEEALTENLTREERHAVEELVKKYDEYQNQYAELNREIASRQDSLKKVTQDKYGAEIKEASSKAVEVNTILSALLPNKRIGTENLQKILTSEQYESDKEDIQRVIQKIEKLSDEEIKNLSQNLSYGSYGIHFGSLRTDIKDLPRITGSEDVGRAVRLYSEGNQKLSEVRQKVQYDPELMLERSKIAEQESQLRPIGTLINTIYRDILKTTGKNPDYIIEKYRKAA